MDDRNGQKQNDPVEKRAGRIKEDDASGEGAGSVSKGMPRGRMLISSCSA